MLPPPVNNKAACQCGAVVDPESLREAPGITWVWEREYSTRYGWQRVRWHARCWEREATRAAVERAR